MSQRNHDPTMRDIPEFSTTGTLREALERLENSEFMIIVTFGGEADGLEAIQSG